MHDPTRFIRLRLDRYLTDLIRPALHAASVDLDVSAWAAPGEPVPFAQAVVQPFAPFPLPQPWGRPWGTVWFRIQGEVPEGWAGANAEVIVDLGFDPARTGFQCEGAVYTPDGTIVKGLHPRSQHVPLRLVASDGATVRSAGGGRPTANPHSTLDSHSADDSPAIDFFVEAAANPDLAANGWTMLPTPLGDKATAGDDPLYNFRCARAVLVVPDVYELLLDLEILDGLSAELPASSSRTAQILRCIDAALDRLDPGDVAASAAAARAELAPALAVPADPSAHRVHAVGNSHIDSAWLWPVRETRRKCRRTFANALALIDEDPGFTFAASSAQQFAWVEEDDPALFERIRTAVAAGRFVPVGSMWVEPDMNLIGSEPLARQLIMGKRYFLDRFGVDTQSVWLPDTFGYSAALPQLIRQAGSSWFMTTKISWNDTNKMPHTTFAWEGIDGTRVLTHLPPAESYETSVTPAEVARSERNFAEKGWAGDSLLLYGFGDGGGGPTREMVGRARRQADLSGSPRVILDTPEGFREAAARDEPGLPVWQGELYLEFHRGTLTSQARTKQGNRRVEALLHEAELWCATAAVRAGRPYPAARLDDWWRRLLLTQFHDILPGTSIAWVRQETEAEHAALVAEVEECIGDALASLVGAGTTKVTVNPAPVPNGTVIALGAVASEPAPAPPEAARAVTPADTAPIAHHDSHAAPIVHTHTDTAPVAHTRSDDGGWVLDNGLVRVRVGADGTIPSIVFDGREVVARGHSANVLQLHRDIPNKWEAWDVERHDLRAPADLREVTAVGLDPAGAVVVERTFGASTVRQTIALAPGEAALDFTVDVDWHERQKLLKVAFPLDVHAGVATSEIQFGHVDRPISQNTSWDEARFETVHHRWVHVGEPGFGVALVNDSTYAMSVDHDSDGAGRTSTCVRLSLLRGPIFPDPDADLGRHRFGYRLVVGATVPDAIEQGYRLNLPPRQVPGDHGFVPLCASSHPGVLIETVKLADDGSGDVVLRIYEAYGGRASTAVSLGVPARSLSSTDLLERPLEDLQIETDATGSRTQVELRPFEIRTLRWRLAD